MKKKPEFLIGAHISIAGGFEKSVDRAASIHCTCMQIFTKSNRQWKAKPIDKQEASLFIKAQKATPTLHETIAHATYLINVGSPEKEVSEKSTAALTVELDRCAMLNISHLVLHPGSRLNSSVEDCIALIAKNIDRALEASTGKTTILLETMAGQGSSIGSTFEQLAAIRNQVKNKKRVAFCLDTCHVFAAGYDFRTKETYEAMWDAFDKQIGIENLKAIHLNDSKKGLGSKVDRHEDIGKGEIGLEGFKLLVNDERFFSIPKILETPKEGDLEGDAKNIKTVKGLLSRKTKEKLTIVG